MRILLAFLITAVIAFVAMAQAPAPPAQPPAKAPATPEAQAEAAAAAPAKVDDQAKTAEPAAPAIAASPVPATGEQWITGSVDLGYRWVGEAGNLPTYRSIVNLGSGPKLTGLDFTITDPKHRLFDRIDARANAWGGDPYNTAHIDVSKRGLYELRGDYRNIAYFNAMPSFANPLAPRGFDEQSFDIRRRSGYLDLQLFPGKHIVPYLVFERNSGYGQGVETWVQDSNDSLAVPMLLRDSTNNYRGGLRFEFRRQDHPAADSAAHRRAPQGVGEASPRHRGAPSRVRPQHPPRRQRGGQEAAQKQETGRRRRKEGARRHPKTDRRLHAENRSGRQDEGKRDPRDPLAGGAGDSPARLRLRFAAKSSAFSLHHVATSIAHFVSFELHIFDALCRLRLLANFWHGTLIAVIRMETVIYVAVELIGAMKPWAGANEDAPGKPFRTVVAVGGTCIRGDVVITVGTVRSYSDADCDADLRLGFGGGSREADRQDGN